MKIIRIIFLAFFLIVSNASVILASTPPPPSTAKSAATTADEDDIPPPGLPINEHIPYLLAGGFILGMTIIYRNKIKKASV
ncbi:hypothetical protein [Flavobacterium soyae]|uniref:PEP-CTERM protein-sorting domain-containing protein n=1 Tax=Flavobacterium soyae TaxID=2903098 RepID=A0ABZ2UJM8_9FLAO|nr:hypothetical protein [Flavobacterium soyae]MCD9576138.1 hypothetical protein [Flavobacterium soyae]